jgi:hypothetical protein
MGVRFWLRSRASAVIFPHPISESFECTTKPACFHSLAVMVSLNGKNTGQLALGRSGIRRRFCGVDIAAPYR